MERYSDGKTFSELGLSEKALHAVEKLGYSKPTPVQCAAIPIIESGRDLIAAASTGTGKTAAFLLPGMESLAPSTRVSRAPRMLIITPTRELAQQISRCAITVGKCMSLFVTTIYGGTKYGPQVSALKEGTDVLIATPGRLCDLMKRTDVNLSRIEVLVFDEADRMLDMGFLPDVKRIVSDIPDSRQTLLFSATIDASIESKLGGMLLSPEIVQISKRGETAEDVKHYIMPVKQKNKSSLLMDVLHSYGANRVIVFARTKQRVNDIYESLALADIASVRIHSDLTQAERKAALKAFDTGKAGVIVATDVLARGIDIDGVDYVVNYDLPDMNEDYIHRIGRTGRAGKSGMAISFVSQNSLKALISIERLLGHEIPVKELPGAELDIEILKSRREKRKLSHSDRRAADFQKVRERRRKAHGQENAYDYDGWKDKGKAKSKPKKKTGGKKETDAKQSKHRRGQSRVQIPTNRKSGAKNKRRS